MLHYLHQEHVEVNFENLFDELTSKYLSVIRQFNNIDQNKLNQLIKQIKNTKNIYIIEFIIIFTSKAFSFRITRFRY